MKKEYLKKSNEEYYLLGVDQNNDKVYLKKATFDCDWYWGIGYIETFNGNELIAHNHFDYLFLKKNIFNSFKEYFKETVLTENEIWQLLELMKTLYVAREYSDVLHMEGANISKNFNTKIIANKDEYERLNKKVIPELLEKVYKLLK